MKKMPFLIASAIAVAAGWGLSFVPVIGHIFIMIPLVLLLLILAVAFGFVQKPTTMEVIAIPFMIVAMILLMVVLGFVTIMHLTWTQVIVAGVITDLVLTVTGFLEVIPLLGTILSNIAGFYVPYMYVGGVWGALLGTVASVIAILPGHIPFLVTIVFVVIKIIATLLFGG
jgi:hypothetical protein